MFHQLITGKEYAPPQTTPTTTSNKGQMGVIVEEIDEEEEEKDDKKLDKASEPIRDQRGPLFNGGC